MKELVNEVLKRNQRSIGRLISVIENDGKDSREAMRLIHKHSGNAYVMGITGVAGSGKSTLICGVTRELRRRGHRVGIIAIDPTSPFSGGAVLGDRVRMLEFTGDEGVFIRSMGTHGSSGGLSGSVYDVIEILDAAGSNFVIVETVGVGQDEIDIVKFADTTVVVTVPGLGDFVQTIKAGIMEIGDILVVNKADRPGTAQTIAELESMLDLGGSRTSRRPPILKTVAKEGDGVKELVDKIHEHKKFLEDTVGAEGLFRRRYKSAVIELARKTLTEKVQAEFDETGRAHKIIDKIVSKELDLHSAADEILKNLAGK